MSEPLPETYEALWTAFERKVLAQIVPSTLDRIVLQMTFYAAICGAMKMLDHASQQPDAVVRLADLQRAAHQLNARVIGAAMGLSMGNREKEG